MVFYLVDLYMYLQLQLLVLEVHFGIACCDVYFGLSTLPALFHLDFFGLFKQSNLRNLFIKLASILVITFGIYIDI